MEEAAGWASDGHLLLTGRKKAAYIGVEKVSELFRAAKARAITRHRFDLTNGFVRDASFLSKPSPRESQRHP